MNDPLGPGFSTIRQVQEKTFLSHIRDSNQTYIGKELFGVKCGAGHIMNVSF